jgi:hypothetical protein
MIRERSPKGINQRVPGVQTPLQKSIRRALTKRASGLHSLRKNVVAQVARWRVEGMREEDILPSLMAIASDVACATGNDRIDLVSGAPRWAYVAQAIERILESAVAEPPLEPGTAD